MQEFLQGESVSKEAGSPFSCPGGVPFLQLRDACVRIGGRIILQVDNFSLAEGESLAILGPNGSGKSTFVKLLTRELLPLYRDEPPVLFRGNPRATLVEVRAALGMVSASMQEEIAVNLPALDIVGGGLTGTLGLPFHVPEAVASAARAQAAGALEQLGIGELAARDMRTLSTGQARRVLIARALMGNPDVLVFDEPTTGLDPQGMYYVRKAMEDLQAAGKAVVLVTHYPEDITPAIGRVVLVRDGEVVADGPKNALLTSETMSELFAAPLRVTHDSARDRYFLA